MRRRREQFVAVKLPPCPRWNLFLIPSPEWFALMEATSKDWCNAVDGVCCGDHARPGHSDPHH
jgi:hypothetical protein